MFRREEGATVAAFSCTEVVLKLTIHLHSASCLLSLMGQWRLHDARALEHTRAKRSVVCRSSLSVLERHKPLYPTGRSNTEMSKVLHRSDTDHLAGESTLEVWPEMTLHSFLIGERKA